MTDVHLKRVGQLHASVLATVRARNPALIVLTGDMPDSAAALPALYDFCRQLAGPQRTILAVLGNHEHQRKISPVALTQGYAQSGVHLLINQHFTVPRGLTVIGLDDGSTGHADLTRALDNMPAPTPKLLLSHAPAFFDRQSAACPRVALALAGHTHGGQVRLGPLLPPLPPDSGRFVAGFYETPLGRAYVSRGIGTTLLPLRFMCPPELPFFRLEPA